MARVVACGLATLDVVQVVDHLPRPNEKMVADGLAVASGGPAANAAVCAAALGADARLVTRAGRSPLGALVTADLEAHGVQVIDLAEPDDSPAVSTVLVTAGTGERAVVSVNATRSEARPAPTQRTAEVADADVVLVDGHHLDLAIEVATAARAAHVPVLADAGSWKPGLERLLALVDIAVLSADLHVPSEVPLPGDVDADDPVAAVTALGPGVVAQSHGGGSIIATGSGLEGTVAIPVPQVTVIDTLGAGDVLHGALAAWITTHGVNDMHSGLTWAARVASASCTSAGARGWITAGIVDDYRAELSETG
jgi:sugar/nucleoside kinase (ribokinase family)